VIFYANVCRERIIEWKVRESDPPKPLLDLRVTKFVHQVRARTAAPGGGSVSALVGAMVKLNGDMQFCVHRFAVWDAYFCFLGLFFGCNDGAFDLR